MRHFLTTILLTTLTLMTQTALADGLLYQLPKDGAFVLYDLDIEMNRGGEKIASKGTFKMSTVGAVMENGKNSAGLNSR